MPRTKSQSLLGITNSLRLTQLDVIREQAQEIWVRGLINHPDFTLHGVQHSEAILRAIDNLMVKLRSNVSFKDTERFLIGASAYLHDIGMLIDIDGFIEERLIGKTDIQLLESEQQR